MTISRFNIGDKVYAVQTELVIMVAEKCPACAGSGRWSGEQADGVVFSIECRMCYGKGKVKCWAHVGSAVSLTIGMVMIKLSTKGPGDAIVKHVEYMAYETGVGTGAVWQEHNLFTDQQDAKRRADELAEERNERMGGTK